MDGLIALIGFIGLYAWAWRRIARHETAKGRKRWIAHVAGLLMGALPALFFVVGVAVSSPTEENPTPASSSIIIGWTLFAFSTWSIFGWTRKAASAKPASEKRVSTPLPPVHPLSPAAKEQKPTRKKTSFWRRKSLDVIEFSYPDSRTGGYSRRTVTVCAVDHKYLEGICHTRNDQRTFSLHRIRGAVTSTETGEILSPVAWAAEMRRRPDNGSITNPFIYGRN